MNRKLCINEVVELMTRGIIHDHLTKKRRYPRMSFHVSNHGRQRWVLAKFPRGREYYTLAIIAKNNGIAYALNKVVTRYEKEDLEKSVQLSPRDLEVLGSISSCKTSRSLCASWREGCEPQIGNISIN